MDPVEEWTRARATPARLNGSETGTTGSARGRGGKPRREAGREAKAAEVSHQLQPVQPHVCNQQMAPQALKVATARHIDPQSSAKLYHVIAEGVGTITASRSGDGTAPSSDFPYE